MQEKFFFLSATSTPEVTSQSVAAALTCINISPSCSTLSIHWCSNKHIHAQVASHLTPIQYLSGSSALFLGWFIQPLTTGSLWTSEHIRRQTQEPSALIMSHCSVHGHEIHPSLSFCCILSLFHHAHSRILYPLRSMSFTFFDISIRWLWGDHLSRVYMHAEGRNLNQTGILIISFAIYLRFEVKHNPVSSILGHQLC